MLPQNLINTCLLPLLQGFRLAVIDSFFSLLHQLLQLIPSNTVLDIGPDHLIEIQFAFDGLLFVMTLVEQFVQELDVSLLFDFGVGAEPQKSHEGASCCAVYQQG
jgi:hypothetical protein